MPPKKKASGKKKKGKKSGKMSSTSKSGVEQLNELSKEFFLIQIRDLENRLGRYQKRCDELSVANGQFHEKFEQMDTDKKEIVSFWKKQVEQKTDEIADLNDRLIALGQAKDTEKREYESQLQQLRSEYQEMKDNLTSENMILGGKLASLEEFKVQKEDLKQKFAMMEEALAKKDEDHKNKIYDLEKKNVIDKDRLKKDMIVKVNTVAAEFRKVSNKQMAETTKRTIRENVSINAQLGKMSDKTMELIRETDDYKSKEKKCRQQIELLEMNEKELAKKNHSNIKMIRMLTEKCRNQEAIISEYELREQEYQDIENESELLRRQIESSREEIQSLAKENEQQDSDIEKLVQTLNETRTNKSKVDQVLSDAAKALRVALRKESEEDLQDDDYEVERRDQMLEQLLVLLNSAAAVGLGPHPGDLGKHPEQRDLKSTSSRTGIRKNSATMSPLSKSASGSIGHYSMGDLGLIPRPTKMQPTLERIRSSSATKLGSLKKVLTRSVAVQTASAPKAMFYAEQLLSNVPSSAQAMIYTKLHDKTSPLAPIATKKLTSKAY